LAGISPTPEEQSQRNVMMGIVLDCIRKDRTIKLPDFDPNLSRPSDEFALQSVGLETNQFGGKIGPYRYQFEGEEDLLHLIVSRQDGVPVSPQEGQTVCGFVLEGVPAALIWLRPGSATQHFYVGHDELLKGLRLE
jgi:hypothetical protein